MNNPKHKYQFHYECRFSFLPAIKNHFFKMRIIPIEGSCQHILEKMVSIEPNCSYNIAKDGFGNTVIYGSYLPKHNLFKISCQGIAKCKPYNITDTTPAEIYQYETHLTSTDANINGLAAGKTPLEIMHAVHKSIEYKRLVTDNTTTAAQVLKLGQGVCQDYAHLMIAACRSNGFYARYVNGLTIGEGETHAWVEVWQNGEWIGFDPTLDQQIEYGYLKFAHGRDVADCPTNRGRFYSWAMETMNVNCKLIEI